MIGVYALSLMLAVPVGLSALWSGMGHMSSFLCYCASGITLYLGLAIGLPDKDGDYCDSRHSSD